MAKKDPAANRAKSRIQKMIMDLSRKINLVNVDDIQPSPENDSIYGAIVEDNELVDLGNDIVRNGILEPIVVTEDGYIISGHRRYAAAKLVRVDQVPVTVLDDVCRMQMSTHEYKRLLRRYNHQRLKNTSQRLREKLLDVDPDIAHKQLIDAREERDRDSPLALTIRGTKTRKSISAAKRPMLNAIIGVVGSLREYWPLTVRQVHYQLLNDPPLRHSEKPASAYTNDRKSYQDLCDLLARARLLGEVPFEAITDETRPTKNTSFSIDAASFVDSELYHLFRHYRRDLLQSQLDHIELIAEKLTVQGIIQPVANRYCLPLTIGRGYCSLEPRRRIVDRFQQSGKDRLILLVASDHDPDGMEICDSFARSIRDDFGIDEVVTHKILLTAEQVKAWRLPPNGMEAKTGSANYQKFVERFGTDVFELEAVDPSRMQKAIANAIESVIDIESFNQELELEKQDARYLQGLKLAITDSIQDLEI